MGAGGESGQASKVVARAGALGSASRRTLYVAMDRSLGPAGPSSRRRDPLLMTERWHLVGRERPSSRRSTPRDRGPVAMLEPGEDPRAMPRRPIHTADGRDPLCPARTP